MADNDDVVQQESDEENQIDVPKNALKGMLQQMEVSLMRNRGGGGLDLTVFDREQKDKLLEILDKNEENAYKYHTKRLEVNETLAKKSIDAQVVNQRTTRFTIMAMIALFLILTVLIVCFKEAFFIPWLTFTAGLVGGSGLSKLFSTNNTISKITTVDKDDEESDT